MSIKKFANELYECLITAMPSNRLGMTMRYNYYRRKLASCNGFFSSKQGFKIYGPGVVSIGKNCQFSDGVIICADAPIFIGDDAIFGFRSSVVSGNHRFSDISKPIREQGGEGKPVRIGRDVWIGSDAKILPGVTIGDGAVVGANAVVTRDIPPYSVAVGVPARLVKSRGM